MPPPLFVHIYKKLGLPRTQIKSGFPSPLTSAVATERIRFPLIRKAEIVKGPGALVGSGTLVIIISPLGEPSEGVTIFDARYRDRTLKL
jgi:hypothetical protein